MGRLFGTDGVRGLANRDVTPELALALSVAAARVLAERGEFAGHRPLAVVGRDPRASGELLEGAVVAGLASAGVDVVRLGVLPTPAVAHLTGASGADVGVVLSASHNAMPDNGIKFFARGGTKLPDAVEDEVEAHLDDPWERPVGAAVGRVRDDPRRLGVVRGARRRLGTAPARRPAGRRSTPPTGPPTGPDRRRSARSVPRSSPSTRTPTGSTSTTTAARRTRRRCRRRSSRTARTPASRSTATPTAASPSTAPASSSTATRSWRSSPSRCVSPDRWPGTPSSSTVMANEGFRVAMRGAGIDVVDTAVGDRYVLEAMRAGSYTLGGEQSGHVVLLDHATTGDGLLTAVHLLGEVAATGKPLGELAAVVKRLPQVLVNVGGVDRARVDSDEELGGRRPRRRGRARRDRPGPAAPLGHRAARPRHGRGRHRGAGLRRRGPARRRGDRPAGAALELDRRPRSVPLASSG